MVDILQCGGRALCNSDDDALFVVFCKPWVHEVTLNEYNEGDLGNPDHPRGPLKLTSLQRERTPFSCLKLAKSATCLQAEFASYLANTSQAGTDGSLYSLDQWLIFCD
jgi:hypothetical protein